MVKAINVANFFVQLVNSLPNEHIDNLKINKLLYFAQGHCLARLGKPLFEDAIQAWDYGPVVPAVYHAFKCCGRSNIEFPTEDFDESILSSDELELLIDVYSDYGRYTSNALKEMSHEPGAPWSQVYKSGCNCIIPNEQMRSYFVNHPLKTFELDPDRISTIDVLPKEWDSDEDSVYDV